MKQCSENQPFVCHLQLLRIHQSDMALGRNRLKVPALVRKFVLHQMFELSSLLSGVTYRRVALSPISPCALWQTFILQGLPLKGKAAICGTMAKCYCLDLFFFK